MRATERVKLALIILDLDLAGENGLMLMKFFQRNQSGVPIILYTGMCHDDDAIKAMLQQGAHQYVRKGALADLRKAVQAAVR
jgi:DNA-binding response OmpR family regulator